MERDSLLSSIDRRRLDFDFEKVCSVTLAQTNVYVCLTCGRYLQGRSPNSPAHQHSLQTEHSLFLQLDTKRVYHLPDNVEFDDPSLSDIRYALYPVFHDLRVLDEKAIESVDLHGRKFIAGFIGMNNIKINDYANVILHNVLQCSVSSFERTNCNLLVRVVGEAARKVWNPMPFKALFSPHEFMLAVSLASDRRYSVNQQADALDFLIWLLNTLHRDFLAIGSRIVADTFQGQVQVSSKRLKAHELAAGAADGNFDTKTVPFFYLSLDLPPVPLYQSPTGEYLVPQVPLQQLLVKYDGGQLTQRGDLMQAFSLEHLPEYLILHYRRFTKSHLVIEKNRTVVSHPMTGLPVQNCTAFLVSNCLARQETILYDIIANICHVGEAALGKGHFLVQLLHPANGHWIEIDDLNVKEIPALNVPLCESFIQVWRRQFK